MDRLNYWREEFTILLDKTKKNSEYIKEEAERLDDKWKEVYSLVEEIEGAVDKWNAVIMERRKRKEELKRAENVATMAAKAAA